MSLTVDAVDIANAVELPTTDSYGSRSDVSLKYVPTRPKMDVVCVIDLHGGDRKKAYEDVKVACAAINTHNISLTHIQVSTYIPTLILKYICVIFLLKYYSSLNDLTLVKPM